MGRILVMIYQIEKQNTGFVMLFAVTLSSIILAITLGVANIALKEINFSTSARETNNAFFAADAGIECALFNDRVLSRSFVETGSTGVVSCLNNPSIALSGSYPSWNFVLPGLAGSSCTKVNVVKDNVTSFPLIKTTIIAKGYNIGDGSCNSTSANRIEREVRVVYGTPAIFLVASSQSTAALNSTSIVVDKPAGVIQNNVLIASIAFMPSTANISSTPSGWTLVRRINNATPNGNSLATYRKVVGASEPSTYTWGFDVPTTGLVGGVLGFAGVSTSNPINVENGQTVPSSAGLIVATPSVNATVPNTMVVTIHSVANGTTWSSPSGMTEGVDTTNVPPFSSTGQSIEMNYVNQQSSGSTGVKTATQNSSGGLPAPDSGNSQIIVLQP